MTGDPLQGAWFRVRYLGGISGSGGTIIAERQTSSNGTFVLTGLKAGTYIIEEISAPDGYVISEDDIQTVYLSGEEQDVITVTFGNDAKGSLLIKKYRQCDPRAAERCAIYGDKIRWHRDWKQQWHLHNG